MSENFFLDNPDLQFRLEHLDLREVVELKENGYSESGIYATAPRNYADAKDNTTGSCSTSWARSAASA